ncbi:MAG TPA: hypothetical protein VIP09_12170 [Dehalococcoidia bacterium]
MAMSDYLEGQIRADLFRTTARTRPTVQASSLATASTTDAHTGATFTEVTNANAYARQNLAPLDANWSAPDATGGLTANLSAITFPTCTTATWGTVTDVVLCDSATWGAGNALFHGALTASKTVGVGDVFQFAIAALSVTFS